MLWAPRLVWLTGAQHGDRVVVPHCITRAGHQSMSNAKRSVHLERSYQMLGRNDLPVRGIKNDIARIVALLLGSMHVLC